MSNHKKLILFLMCTAITILPLLNVSLSSQDDIYPNKIQELVSLLHNLLPELQPGMVRQFSCSSEVLSSGFMPSYEWQLSEGKVDQKKTVVANGYMGLSPEGQVLQVFINGPFSNQERLDKLKKVAKAGLEYKSLKTFDGKTIKYGPYKKELMQSKVKELIPQLEKFLNVNLHQKNIVYFRDGSRSTDQQELPDLTWCASFFKPTGSSKSATGAMEDNKWIIQCELEFEPFDGRLISIMVWHRTE